MYYYIFFQRTGEQMMDLNESGRNQISEQIGRSGNSTWRSTKHYYLVKISNILEDLSEWLDGSLFAGEEIYYNKKLKGNN